MRLIFVNRFYFPDQSATSQLLTDLTEHLATEGRTVVVVTSRQRFDDLRVSLPSRETVRGVAVHRLFTSRFGRSTILGRALDYLSFYGSCLIFLIGFLRGGDVLICKTDPPLISVIGALAAHLRGAILVNWLQDLYPEIASAFGMSLAHGPIGAALTWARDRTLRSAAANVAIGEDMAARVAARGVAPTKVFVISNWANDEAISEPASAEALRQAWGLSGAFVVGYSGNLGRAHEYETLLAAAQQLRGREQIRFLFIGGGHHIASLTEAVQARGMERAFVFQPHQDRTRLGESLRVADVHWVSLRSEFNGLIVPSKIYGVLAAGRPLIAVAGDGDEIARLARDEAIGIAVKVGDATGLAAAIASLADDAQLTRAMGMRAQALLRARFTRRGALETWSSLLDAVVRPACQRP